MYPWTSKLYLEKASKNISGRKQNLIIISKEVPEIKYLFTFLLYHPKWNIWKSHVHQHMNYFNLTKTVW